MNKKVLYFIYKDRHPAFRLLYEKPPINIKNIFKENINDISFESKTSENQFSKRSSLKNLKITIKNLFSGLFNLLKLPIIIPVLPSRRISYDYIFSDKLVVSKKPFICYVDYIGNLVNWNDLLLKSTLCLSIIKKFFLSKRCKYVFNWSKSAKNQLIQVLNIPKSKQHKFKTIYPSIEGKVKSVRNDNLVRLLFISSVAKFDKNFNFYMKGGKLVLQSYEKLKSKYNNLQLTYIGYIPEEYKHFEQLPDVDFYPRVSYAHLMELYSNTDIFLFPTYADVFGFTFIEAMAYGLPIICINNNSTAPELVIDNKTGFVVETSQKFLYFPLSKYCPDWISKMRYYDNLRNYDDSRGLNNFIEKLELLIVNKELREELGRNGRERVVNGIFSLEYRNKKLFNLFNNSN